MAQQPCNLVRIAMDVIRDCLPRAMDNILDLGYEACNPRATTSPDRGTRPY